MELVQGFSQFKQLREWDKRYISEEREKTKEVYNIIFIRELVSDFISFEFITFAKCNLNKLNNFNRFLINHRYRVVGLAKLNLKYSNVCQSI